MSRETKCPGDEHACDDTRIRDALADLDGSIPGTAQAYEYASHRNRYASDAKQILRNHAGGELLEIGSAPCHSTALLTLLGIRVVGVDLRPRRCAKLVQRYGLDVRQCDIEREALPFADASFPTALLAETLEHLRVDPLFTLSEINRVLEPGGRLLLTTPNLYALQNIARFLLGRGITDGLTEFAKLRHIGHMGHVREYTHGEVRRLLHAHGFEIRERDFRHYHYPRGKRGLAARLAFTILPRRFRTYQVVVAEKTAEGPRLAPL